MGVCGFLYEGGRKMTDVSSKFILLMLLVWCGGMFIVGCGTPPPTLEEDDDLTYDPTLEHITGEIPVDTTKVKEDDLRELFYEYRMRSYGDTQENVRMGLCYMRGGLLDDAESEFKKAIDFDPGFPEAHINLGILYMKRKMWLQALDEFKISQKLAPCRAEIYCYMSKCYFRIGEKSKSSEVLRYGIDMDPEVANCTVGSVEAPAAPVSMVYDLTIRSYPEGASIYVNDFYKGMTPIVLQDMDLGLLHKIKISKTGYVIDHQVLEFKAQNQALLEVTLVPAKTVTTIITDTGKPPIVYPPPEVELKIEPIRFDIGKATIRTEAYPILDALGIKLQRFPEYGLVLEGHTDITGSLKHNMLLSIARAQSVGDYLSAHYGIAPDRFVIRGYGPNIPNSDNESSWGKQQNRRTEMVLVVRTNGGL